MLLQPMLKPLFYQPKMCIWGFWWLVIINRDSQIGWFALNSKCWCSCCMVWIDWCISRERLTSGMFSTIDSFFAWKCAQMNKIDTQYQFDSWFSFETRICDKIRWSSVENCGKTIDFTNNECFRSISFARSLFLLHLNVLIG